MRSSWTRYADFGPTLATEVLLEKARPSGGVDETLGRWMMADGLWLSRAQRTTFHQPRLRRSYGELIQKVDDLPPSSPPASKIALWASCSLRQ
jgi:hypothetical protein